MRVAQGALRTRIAPGAASLPLYACGLAHRRAIARGGCDLSFIVWVLCSVEAWKLEGARGTLRRRVYPSPREWKERFCRNMLELLGFDSGTRKRGKGTAAAHAQGSDCSTRRAEHAYMLCRESGDQ